MQLIQTAPAVTAVAIQYVLKRRWAPPDKVKNPNHMNSTPDIRTYHMSHNSCGARKGVGVLSTRGRHRPHSQVRQQLWFFVITVAVTNYFIIGLNKRPCGQASWRPLFADCAVFEGAWNCLISFVVLLILLWHFGWQIGLILIFFWKIPDFRF